MPGIAERSALRCERIGDAVLYCADAREVLATIGAVDATVADPPYGVGYKGSVTRKVTDAPNPYRGFDDTPDFVAQVCVPIVLRCIDQSTRVAVTPGLRCSRLYPPPDGKGVFWYPSGANSGPWGFVMHQPIYFYGACPYLKAGKGSQPTGFRSVEAAEKNGHPCPKPIRQMEWLVNRVSLPGELVLDPFMGSGTTGVACVNTGRRFVGVEIEASYFDIACARIDAAQRQGRLFA